MRRLPRPLGRDLGRPAAVIVIGAFRPNSLMRIRLQKSFVEGIPDDAVRRTEARLGTAQKK